MSGPLPSSESGPARYPTLAGLQAAHTALLRRLQAGDTEQMAGSAEALLGMGIATGELLAEPDERRAAQAILDFWAARMYRVGTEPPDSTLADFNPQLAPELPDGLCPYLGLEAFGEDDSDRFFGRRELIARLVERLGERRLLAVVGPSGSGKSSVVRAGLVRELRRGALPGSAQWHILTPILPGSDPLAALDRALAAGLPPAFTGQPPGQHPDTLLHDLLIGPPSVIIVDQFEEIFTLCDDQSVREAFVARLLAFVSTPDPPHRVILTMRSDFETFVARLPTLQPLFEAGRVQVTPLSATELRDAIERPAEQVGLLFESGVVDLLLQDMLGEPAGLPLLQFTLVKLWEQRTRNRVTRAAYDRVGGGRLALARSADALYATLIPQDQTTARRILLRLVRPGDGLELTSRRIRRSELYRSGEDASRIDRVIDKLIDARLVRQTAGATSDDTQIEVAHEAIVRNWPTLVGWLEEERVALALRRRFESRAAEWVRLGKGQGGLLDETELREAERWLTSAEAAYLGYEQALPDLVAASRAALVAAQAAEDERQRALLRAEAEAASRKRLTRLVYALALVSLLALMFAVYALTQRNQVIIEANQRATVVVQRTTAEADARGQAQTAVAASAESARQTRIARASELAVRAQSALPSFPQQSLLFAVSANTIALDVGEQPIAAARQALYDALGGAGGRGLSGHAGPITALAISHDSRWLATASQDAVVLVWELGAGGATNPRRLAGHTGPITALAISHDNRWLATVGWDATARLWDLSAADPARTVRTLVGHTAILRAVAFSPDDRWLVTAGDDATARLWDLESPSAPAVPLLGHTNAIWLANFSPAGTWLATASLDGTARVWDIEHLGATVGVRILEHQNNVLTGLQISPNGRWLITSAADRIIRRWDLAAADPNTAVAILQGQREDIVALAISPDGRALASSEGGGRVRLWELDSADPNDGVRDLVGSSGSLATVVFSPDGRWLAGASADSTVRLWDLQAADPQARILRGHEAGVSAVAFSPDGRWLVSGSDDATARLWAWPHHDDTAVARVLEGHAGAINVLALSADGQRLATAGDDGTARVWDLAALDPNATPVVLRGHTGRIVTMAMRPDGRFLYTAGDDAVVREWDLGASDPNQAVRTLTGHTGPVAALALSRDGRRLVSGSADMTAQVWDLAAADPNNAPIVLSQHSNQVLAVAFSPDGRYVATGSYDTTARVWDLTAPDPNAASVILEGHTVPITAVVFSHDGRTLATSGEGGELWLWEPATTQSSTRAHQLTGHTGAVTALAFSPDDRQLASAGEDGVIRLWPLQQQAVITEPRLLQGHARGVLAIAFNSDATRLVSGGVDQTVRLWNLSDSQVPGALVLGRHSGSVFQVAYLPNANTVVSSGQDGVVQLWELRIPQLVTRACAAAGRSLTESEWQLYFPEQPYRAGCSFS